MAAQPSGLSPEDITFIAGAQRLETNIRFLVAAFAILIFDHVITFGEEVERIWKEKFTPATVLFFINRYINPLAFLITIFGYTYPRWPKLACHRFVAFEGSAAAAIVAVCELIMIMRVFALYNRNLWLLGGLMLLWSGQIIAAGFGVASGFAAQLPSGMDYCVLTGKSRIFAALWIGPLITDTILFLLTLYRSKQYLSRVGGQQTYAFQVQKTLWVLVRDGTVYFFVIVLVNLFSILVFLLGPEDIKSLGGPFWQTITSVMVSRLVINLRASTTQNDPVVRGPSDTFETGFGGRSQASFGEVTELSFRVSHTARDGLETSQEGSMSVHIPRRPEGLSI